MLTENNLRVVTQVAQKMELEPALLCAVVEVETSGKFFEDDGRTPRFLFERHKFYQELKKLAPERLEEAVAAKLAHSDWRKNEQYLDQGTSVGRMRVLAQAKAVHMEAALRACSWGAGQIMGFNAEKLGYSNATAMVMSFQTLAGQLEGIVRFLNWKNLLDVLRRKEWAKFARGYNGEAYAKNSYDTKLSAAYVRWHSKLSPDLPDEPEIAPVSVIPVQNAEVDKLAAFKTPEGVAAVVGSTTGVTSVFSGLGNSPIAWALAIVIVGTAISAGYYLFKRMQRNP